MSSAQQQQQPTDWCPCPARRIRVVARMKPFLPALNTVDVDDQQRPESLEMIPSQNSFVLDMSWDQRGGDKKTYKYHDVFGESASTADVYKRTLSQKVDTMFTMPLPIKGTTPEMREKMTVRQCVLMDGPHGISKTTTLNSKKSQDPTKPLDPTDGLLFHFARDLFEKQAKSREQNAFAIECQCFALAYDGMVYDFSVPDCISQKARVPVGADLELISSSVRIDSFAEFVEWYARTRQNEKSMPMLSRSQNFVYVKAHPTTDGGQPTKYFNSMLFADLIGYKRFTGTYTISRETKEVHKMANAAAFGLSKFIEASRTGDKKTMDAARTALRQDPTMTLLSQPLTRGWDLTILLHLASRKTHYFPGTSSEYGGDDDDGQQKLLGGAMSCCDAAMRCSTSTAKRKLLETCTCSDRCASISVAAPAAAATSVETAAAFTFPAPRWLFL